MPTIHQRAGIVRMVENGENKKHSSIWYNPCMKKRLLIVAAMLLLSETMHAEPMGPKKVFSFPPSSAALQSSRTALSIQNDKIRAPKTKRKLTKEEAKAAAKRQKDLSDVLLKLQKMQEKASTYAKKQTQTTKPK